LNNGDLLVIPAAARVSRAARTSLVASAHTYRAAAHATKHAARPAAASHKSPSIPYHTASLNAKHRTSTN